MDNTLRVQVGNHQHKLICYRMGNFEREKATVRYLLQIRAPRTEYVATVLAVWPFNKKLVQKLQMAPVRTDGRLFGAETALRICVSRECSLDRLILSAT